VTENVRGGAGRPVEKHHGGPSTPTPRTDRDSARRGEGGEESHRSPPRVIIESVSPEIDGGRFPAKRVAGDTVRVAASIFTEGHDRLAAVLRFRLARESTWHEAPMRPLPNDRWEAEFRVSELGRHEYTVEAWVDHFASWRHGLSKKVEAGQEVGSELLEGAAMVRAAAVRAGGGADAAWLEEQAALLSDEKRDRERIAAGLSDALADCMARHPDRGNATAYARTLELVVECERARSGAWYEFFPRSCAPEPGRHGTFRDCEARLRHAAAMGFDVVYLPPVHPIGRAYRKGPNNTPAAGPEDPGSPWAIGADEGGHKAVHPDLGSLADFDRLVETARGLGLEVALDIAFQCSPDHPYVKKHPEWFKWRPDGTVQYAENPPKKYQDIYPLHFETERWRELWEELRSVFLFWVDHGVTIFRVDNPHTKPFAFWEWVIREVKEQHPETIFLSEAFTRPSVMKRLAKLGFSQSYTYFTWRNTKWELTEYLRELSTPPESDYMRANLFANTPDILHAFLQTDRRAAYQIRATLAATLAGSYGIYGPPFELCEGNALPGSEEYLDSEKYQVRHWDVARPGNIRDYLTRLNQIRRENPALTRGEGPHFYHVDNEEIIAYGRTLPDLSDIIVVAVNLNPYYVHSGWLELPLEQLGIDEQRPFQVDDLLGGARFLWHGSHNYVSIDPGAAPAHVFRIRRRLRTEQDFDYYL
jgi:starch synthase (maltosyl-transferring)